MSGSKDRGVQFWDPITGNAQMMLQGHKNSGEFKRLFRSDRSDSGDNDDLDNENANSFSADSYLGGSRPNWQSLCYWQWRHACTDLEVSSLSPQNGINQTLTLKT